MIFSWVVMNEMIVFYLQQMSVVHTISQRCSSEEVYDGHLMGFLYDGVCSCFRM